MALKERPEILNLLANKASNKQLVYRNTIEVFNQIKQILHDMQLELAPQIGSVDRNIEIKFTEAGSFELQFKFSGDTLVFMMHTNVFTFPENHFVQQTDYIKKNKQNAYCGLIQVYNFLSDSIKYNRQDDIGELIARIYINREKHFFIEGKRPLNFKHNNFGEEIINDQLLKNIIEESILYCINYDLIIPPVEMIQHITIDMKNYQNYSSGFATSKSVGFELKNQLKDV